MSTTNDRTVNEIEKLRLRYEDLKEKRIQTQTRLVETQKQLETLQKEALAQWGTSNLEELQKKLADQQQENERLRKEYQASLASIEDGLKQIEARPQA